MASWLLVRNPRRAQGRVCGITGAPLHLEEVTDIDLVLLRGSPDRRVAEDRPLRPTFEPMRHGMPSRKVEL